MTLQGLTGTLGAMNMVQKDPTGGAFVHNRNRCK